MISEYVGRALSPSRPYLVGREKVREFALAVGEGAAVCTDLDAARAAGHPDLVAPQTFAAAFTLPLMEAFLRDPAVGQAQRDAFRTLLDTLRPPEGTPSEAAARQVLQVLDQPRGDRLVA